MSDIMIHGSTLANDLRLTPQAKTVLRHLEKGKTISPLEALMVYSIGRLAARIMELRDAGHDICTYSRKDERGHKYGEYALNQRLSLS
jgi:hypothetical protein